MGVDLPLSPPFSRRRWITDIKTPQYEKIQVGFPRPSFLTTKGSSFCQKKSVKASLFSTHYVSINHNLPRCHQGWSCFCGHDGFANPKCLHLSFHWTMNQNYKQRYSDFIMCSGQFIFLVAGQNKLQTINVHCVFGHFGSGKGSRRVRKVQFFWTLFKRPLTPPLFRLNIMWWIFLKEF